MKKAIILILFCMATVHSMAFASDELMEIVNLKPTVFLLKMDKEFIGGQVQVFSSNKKLIVSQKMKKRKLSIDFSEVRAGEYTVRVLKGKQEQEFYFLKK